MAAAVGYALGAMVLYGLGDFVFRLPDGSMRVLVEGLTRAVAKRFQWSNDFYTVTAALYPDEIAVGPEVEALQRNTLQMFQDYVHLNRRIPDEVLATTASIASASRAPP